jgi:hypothetical protein
MEIGYFESPNVGVKMKWNIRVNKYGGSVWTGF